nr:hypothetical protein [Tanacetum cinerariifolium]
RAGLAGGGVCGVGRAGLCPHPRPDYRLRAGRGGVLSGVHRLRFAGLGIRWGAGVLYQSARHCGALPRPQQRAD